MDRKLARARRSGGAVSVALLDFDDFKAFNDAQATRSATGYSSQLLEQKHARIYRRLDPESRHDPPRRDVTAKALR